MSKKIFLGFFIFSKLFFRYLFSLNIIKLYNLSLLFLQDILCFFKLSDKIRIFGKVFYFDNLTNVNATLLEIFFLETYSSVKYLIDKSNPTIIDAGAYIGDSTVYFKKIFPRSKIYSLEPVNFEFLKKNVEKNNLKKVVLLNKALANKSGSVIFEKDSSNSSILSKNGEAIKVKSISLNDLMRFIGKKVDLLKLDIEGAEFSIINSSKLDNIENLIMEVHVRENCEKNCSLGYLLYELEKKGFYCLVLDQNISTFNKSLFLYLVVASKDKSKIFNIARRLSKKI